MRHTLLGLLLMGSTLLPAPASALNIRIGIDVPVYPTLVRIPNYPVYYAPSLRANYFFYDGLYWVLVDDTWYASPWYNGPWEAVDPFDVPDFLLRVPVRYYRFAPAYFRGWAYDAPPRWGEHWGSSWASRRGSWDRWNARSAPAPAPLPVYQKSYSGSRYPSSVSQQAAIQTRSNYSYQPRESVSRQQFQERRTQASAAPQQSTQSSMQQRFAPGQPVPQRTVNPAQRSERVIPAEAGTQPNRERASNQQRQVEHRQQVEQQQAQRQQRRVQQAEVRQQQAAPAPAPQRALPPQAQPHEQRAPHENRGQEKGPEDNGKGHERHEGG